MANKDQSIEKKKNNNGDKIALRADFGEVYITIRNGQTLKPVRVQMALFEGLNHFYKIKDNYAIHSPQ